MFNYTEAAFRFHSAAPKLYEDVLCVSKPIYSHMLLVLTAEYEQARFIFRDQTVPALLLLMPIRYFANKGPGENFVRWRTTVKERVDCLQ